MVEDVEAFLQRFNIVIGASGIPVQTPFNANGFGAIEHKHEFQIDFLLHLLNPSIQIVSVTWKAIDQEFMFIAVRL